MIEIAVHAPPTEQDSPYRDNRRSYAKARLRLYQRTGLGMTGFGPILLKNSHLKCHVSPDST
jgi:hypothetical protein